MRVTRRLLTWSPYLVADALPVCIDFFVQQFKQPGWEKLVVLYIGLLWRPRSLNSTKKQRNLMQNNVSYKFEISCPCVACGVRRAACGVRRAACGVRRAACGAQVSCDWRI